MLIKVDPIDGLDITNGQRDSYFAFPCATTHPEEQFIGKGGVGAVN